MFGSVVADPLTLTPNPTHHDWIQFMNDDLVGKSPDDNLTAGFHGGTHFYDCQVGLEYDMFTNKNNFHRSDKASIILGQTGENPDFHLFLGAGASYSGKMGGQEIQTVWHKITSNDPVELPYEAPVWRPLLLVDARWFLKKDDGLGITPIFKMQTDSDMICTDIMVQFWCSNWVGSSKSTQFIAPRYTRSWGSFPTISEQTTANFYNEFSLMVGIESEPFLIDFSFGRKGSYGEIGFAF